MRICIIGAGAAGLCAARHVSAQPGMIPVVYEKTAQIGGTWVYTDATGTDQYGQKIHSSMYKNLLTNLPKEIMHFPGFPFPEEERSFVHHSRVLEYLGSYAQHYALLPFVKFLTRVDVVEQVDTTKKWRVAVTHVDTNEKESSEFDAVVVCNGHYSTPLIPALPGLDDFKRSGQLMHSHAYRDPEPFRNRRVAVLGAAASGTDISLELARFSEMVYLCHDKPPIDSKFPSNLVQKPGIASLGEGFATLKNGEKISVDFLLFCTGYHFKFPFLCSNATVSIEDERITPLYMHIVHIDHPTMFFIGLPLVVLPFPLFDSQLNFVMEILKGSIKLPPKEEMKKWEKEDFENRLSKGMPPRKAHLMSSMQWDYHGQLAEMTKLPYPVPQSIVQLYNHLHANERRYNLPDYKKKNWALKSDTEFESTGIIE